MKKITITAIISFILGGTITTLILYHQIQNKYDFGYNTGRLDGGFEVINFLSENIKNNSSKEVKDLEKYFHFKYASISVVEINGIKTILIKK